MDQSIQAFQDASPETQEILKELEAEGKGSIPGKESEPTPPPKQEEQPKPKEKVEEPAKPDDKTDDTTQSDQKPNQSDDTQNKSKREPKFVPVGVHTEERHKRQAAEEAAKKAQTELESLRAQIANASNKPASEEKKTEDLKGLFSEMAKKHGIDPDFVSEFADVLTNLSAKQVVLPSDVKETLEKIQQKQNELDSERTAQRQREQELAQENGFNNEFSTLLKEFPDLANQREELKQLAFSEGNTHIPLKMLALQYRYENGLDKPGKKSAEDSTQVANKGSEAILDFENMTEDQLRNLDGDALDKYLAWIDKKAR